MAGRRTYSELLAPLRRLRREKSAGDADHPRRNEDQRSRRSARDRYTIRFLGCLAGSIGLMVLLARLPIEGGWSSVGWYVLRPSEQISVEIVDQRPPHTEAESGTPITRFDDGEKVDPVGEPPDSEPEEAEEMEETTAPLLRSPERLRGRRVFESAHDMPQIIGGIGAYYIHIEYPEEAIRAGVEGRLVLAFVVEVDGHTSGVEVIRPLHPACDSAAVRALRHTRFVPGRQNGEIVPVRMRLPVRFKIVDEGEGSSSSASS